MLKKVKNDIMFFFSLIEYIVLRFIRKYFFTENIINKLQFIIPSSLYKQNINEFKPEQIIEQYNKFLDQFDFKYDDKVILEIGTGRTNSTGYFVAKNYPINTYYCFKPFIPLNSKLDEFYKNKYTIEKSKVFRITEIEKIKENSVDLILSNSVLEHVNDIKDLFKQLKRVLKKDGRMFHIVDYRDHFFKYPFHFLLFSNYFWNYILNPGDLPRYRITDHNNLLKEFGYNCLVLEKTENIEELEKIKSHIHSRFGHYPFNELAVTQAVLYVTLNKL